MTEPTDLPKPLLTVKLNIKMEVGLHPRDHVLAVEQFVQALCKASKKEAIRKLTCNFP